MYVAALTMLCLVGTALYVVPAYAQATDPPRFIQLCHGTLAGASCDTDNAIQPPGDEHQVTVRVTDRDGAPVANVPVEFRETGPAIFTPQGGSTVTVLTDGSGLARASLTSDVEGQSSIVAEISPAVRGSGPTDDECEQPAGAGGDPAAGNCISQTLTMTWRETTRHERTVGIRFDHGTGANSNRLIVFGRLRLVETSFTDCVAQQPLTVQRRIDGRWVTKKTTNTNLRGRYAVELFDRTGRYRVVAPRTAILGADLSHLDVCLKAVTAKRHRHAQS